VELVVAESHGLKRSVASGRRRKPKSKNSLEVRMHRHFTLTALCAIAATATCFSGTASAVPPNKTTITLTCDRDAQAVAHVEAHRRIGRGAGRDGSRVRPSAGTRSDRQVIPTSAPATLAVVGPYDIAAGGATTPCAGSGTTDVQARVHRGVGLRCDPRRSLGVEAVASYEYASVVVVVVTECDYGRVLALVIATVMPDGLPCIVMYPVMIWLESVYPLPRGRGSRT
jgi:hypothetical protein